MSELRQEEIEQFWKNCGYRWYDGLVHSRLCKCGLDETPQEECICPKGQCDREAWPDPSDLNAVFEAATHFVKINAERGNILMWEAGYDAQRKKFFADVDCGLREFWFYHDTDIADPLIRSVNSAAVNTAAKEASGEK